MIHTGYPNDDPREMLKLMQLVHEEHPVTSCSIVGCSLRFEWQPTGPETVRLLTRQEAENALGCDWVNDSTRSFAYAHGMSCRSCGASFGKKVATYGPSPYWEDDWPEPPLSEYTLYAD